MDNKIVTKWDRNFILNKDENAQDKYKVKMGKKKAKSAELKVQEELEKDKNINNSYTTKIESIGGNRLRLTSKPGKRLLLSCSISKLPVVISSTEYQLQKVTPTSFKIVEKIAKEKQRLEKEELRKQRAEQVKQRFQESSNVHEYTEDKKFSSDQKICDEPKEEKEIAYSEYPEVIKRNETREKQQEIKPKLRRPDNMKPIQETINQQPSNCTHMYQIKKQNKLKPVTPVPQKNRSRQVSIKEGTDNSNHKNQHQQNKRNKQEQDEGMSLKNQTFQEPGIQTHESDIENRGQDESISMCNIEKTVEVGNKEINSQYEGLSVLMQSNTEEQTYGKANVYDHLCEMPEQRYNQGYLEIKYKDAGPKPKMHHVTDDDKIGQGDEDLMLGCDKPNTVLRYGYRQIRNGTETPKQHSTQNIQEPNPSNDRMNSTHNVKNDLDVPQESIVSATGSSNRKTISKRYICTAPMMSKPSISGDKNDNQVVEDNDKDSKDLGKTPRQMVQRMYRTPIEGRSVTKEAKAKPPKQPLVVDNAKPRSLSLKSTDCYPGTISEKACLKSPNLKRNNKPSSAKIESSNNPMKHPEALHTKPETMPAKSQGQHLGSIKQTPLAKDIGNKQVSRSDMVSCDIQPSPACNHSSPFGNTSSAAKNNRQYERHIAGSDPHKDSPVEKHISFAIPKENVLISPSLSESDIEPGMNEDTTQHSLSKIEHPVQSQIQRQRKPDQQTNKWQEKEIKQLDRNVTDRCQRRSLLESQENMKAATIDPSQSELQPVKCQIQRQRKPDQQRRSLSEPKGNMRVTSKNPTEYTEELDTLHPSAIEVSSDRNSPNQLLREPSQHELQPTIIGQNENQKQNISIHRGSERSEQAVINQSKYQQRSKSEPPPIKKGATFEMSKSYGSIKRSKFYEPTFASLQKANSPLPKEAHHTDKPSKLANTKLKVPRMKQKAPNPTRDTIIAPADDGKQNQDPNSETFDMPNKGTSISPLEKPVPRVQSNSRHEGMVTKAISVPSRSPRQLPDPCQPRPSRRLVKEHGLMSEKQLLKSDYSKTQLKCINSDQPLTQDLPQNQTEDVNQDERRQGEPSTKSDAIQGERDSSKAKSRVHKPTHTKLPRARRLPRKKEEIIKHT